MTIYSSCAYIQYSVEFTVASQPVALPPTKELELELELLWR